MKNDRKRVVISTFFEGFAIRKIIPRLSPDKLVIILDDSKSTEEKKEKMNQSLESLRTFFKNILEIETLRVSSYDIPKTISEVIRKIDKEYADGNEILIHITEGRKTTSLSILFAGYLRKDKIEGAYYITEEDRNVIKLPILSFDIGETKRKTLKLISEGVKDFDELMSRLNIKQSAVYYNIGELRREGYISKDDKLELTDLGKIVIS